MYTRNPTRSFSKSITQSITQSISKTLPFVFATTLLAGCSGGDDDNQDVVRAIEQQNELLETQTQQNRTSVTLSGSILDIATEQNVEAMVRVRVGTTWFGPLATTNGDFEVTELPANSDFELVVESPDNAFLPRAYFGSTRENTSGAAFQDIGQLGVSEGREYTFAIVDFDTRAPVEGLTLRGFSHVGAGANVDDYAHVSQYNEADGTYSIILPRDISTSVRALLDLDSDGETDYFRVTDTASNSFSVPFDRFNEFGEVPFSATPFVVDSPIGASNSNALFISRFDIENTDTIFLRSADFVETFQNVQLRVSVIDEGADVLSDALLSISDDINGDIEAIFDEQTQQYVFDIEFDQSITILAPAFEENDINYGSSSITLTRDNDGTFRVRGLSTGNSLFYSVPADTESLDLVLQPREIAPISLLRVVAVSNGVRASERFKAFYSSPITLGDDSVRLVEEDALMVVRGNDSDSDLVLPGSTRISREDREIAVSANLSLNDTLLTVTPSEPLEASRRYSYNVFDIEDQFSGIVSDLDRDMVSFVSPQATVSGIFDIADVVLDNNNFTTNGRTIVAQNTANETDSSSFNRSDNVYMYFPVSIEGLRNLVFSLASTTDGSVIRDNDQTLTIVRDGDVAASEVFNIAGIAGNENIQRDFGFNPVAFGNTFDQGRAYRLRTFNFLRDNTESRAATMTFAYSLERANGDVETGRVTLPVR